MATKFFRKKILLARADDAQPFVAADAVQSSNIELTPVAGEEVNRELERSYFGGQPTIVVNQHQTIRFGVEYAAKAAAGTAEPWGPILKACGFSETIVANTSVTYKPVTDSPTAVKLGLNMDGTLHTLAGTRGMFTLELAANAIPRFSFDMTGTWADPAPTPILKGDFADWAEPVPGSKKNTPTLEIFGEAGIPLSSLRLELGATVIHRSLINADAEVLITNREPKLTMTIDRTAWDVFAKVTDRTQAEVTVTHGKAGTRQLSLTMPKCQLSPGVSYRDDNGVMQLEVPAMVLPDAGDDEITLEVS